MADESNIAAKDAIRLLLALSPSTCDESVIRDVLGDRAGKSLSEVAQAFGVAAATVRHTWRRDGMPGDAKAKWFGYADILIWFLKRNNANAAARGVDEFTNRKRSAETRAAEAEALIKERKAEQVAGEYTATEVSASVISGSANSLRDGLMAIPREAKEYVGKKYQSDLETFLRTRIGGELTAFSERANSGIRAAAKLWRTENV